MVVKLNLIRDCLQSNRVHQNGLLDCQGAYNGNLVITYISSPHVPLKRAKPFKSMQRVHNTLILGESLICQ